MIPSRAKILLKQTIVVLCISFALLEIALRTLPSIVPGLSYKDYAYNMWRGKPYSKDYDFQLNSRGYKDVEFAQNKAPGVYRIIGIGDSFAYGVVPYRYNYLTLLGQNLKRCGDYEVINMGIADMQPEHYLALLKNEGLDLSPNLVVINLFLGNDLKIAESTRPWLHSYTVRAVRSLYAAHKGSANDPRHVPGSQYCDDCPSFNPEAFTKIEKKRSVFFRKDSKELTAGVVEAMRCVRAIKDVCDDRKIDLLIVVIPDELQVNAGLQAEVVKALDGNPSDYDFEIPNRLLASGFDKISVKYLDLLEAFKQATLQKRVYKPQDTHWNIAGNALAADLIAKHLARVTGLNCDDLLQARSRQ
ncbi:MAG: SGNH/GDSL hydrolase family protein [Desulfomonile tiedjei]|nr:SGNH/GDSL hydrolase family protein [Desulfomonile tiedjei]